MELKDELASDILKPLALEEHSFYNAINAELLPSVDEDVLRQYLTAQQALQNETPASIREAIIYLKDCVDRDSSFALGYATLAQCYARLSETGEAGEDAIVKSG